MRKIIHLDMDAFFASVEQRDDPALQGRPVIVGGDPERRGVVAAASYEARAFGVRSAMPSSRAARLCPEAVFLKPDFARYRAVSQQLRVILHTATELVEPLSLDEAYLDVTQNALGLPTATKVAQHLRARIHEELRLTASAGVAPSKLVAKIASDQRKPDGLTVVLPGQVEAFLRPLPISRLWGVGPATAARLEALGIRRIGDLAAMEEGAVRARIGSHGVALQALARGQDDRPVRPDRVRKSRGAERTFPEDQYDVERLRQVLALQARDVCDGLQRSQDRGRTVVLKLRYADFSTITRSRSLPSPTDDAEEVLAVAYALLDGTEVGARGVRLIGVTISNLDRPAPGARGQLQLPFADGRPEG